MIRDFKTYLKENANVTDSQLSLLTDKLHYRNIRKDQLVLSKHQVCRQFASYLGITPESLSRIRKDIAKRNS